MLRFIKKSLLWIVSGTVSVILTACYGVGSMAECFSKKITITDSEGNPIKGLEVTMVDDGGNQNRVFTDESGEVEMHFCTDYSNVTVEIFDVDGAENGEFKEKTVVFSTDDNPETVEMESAE
jgi:putative lipoprotein (rSAM/lipoprotein system)